MSQRQLSPFVALTNQLLGCHIEINACLVSDEGGPHIVMVIRAWPHILFHQICCFVYVSTFFSSAAAVVVRC